MRYINSVDGMTIKNFNKIEFKKDQYGNYKMYVDNDLWIKCAPEQFKTLKEHVTDAMRRKDSEFIDFEWICANWCIKDQSR